MSRRFLQFVPRAPLPNDILEMMYNPRNSLGLGSFGERRLGSRNGGRFSGPLGVEDREGRQEALHFLLHKLCIRLFQVVPLNAERLSESDTRSMEQYFLGQ